MCSLGSTCSNSRQEKRVQSAQKLFAEFDGAESRKLFETLTGDDTWIRYSKPLSKEANKVWLLKEANQPMISRY